MPTTTAIQAILLTSVKQWFVDAASGGTYICPIHAENVLAYATTPDEDGEANWCIIAAKPTFYEGHSMESKRLVSRFDIHLFSRFDIEVEASKEAAEKWLNDAEEMIVLALTEEPNNTTNWFLIRPERAPVRDRIREFWNKYRVSTISVLIRKK